MASIKRSPKAITFLFNFDFLGAGACPEPVEGGGFKGDDACPELVEGAEGGTNPGVCGGLTGGGMLGGGETGGGGFNGDGGGDGGTEGFIGVF